VKAVFEQPAKYDPQVKADIIVAGYRFARLVPKVDSIWIQASAFGSAHSVRGRNPNVRLERLAPRTTLGAGLRTRTVARID